MRYVIVTEEKGAALFTINREEAMNALNPEVLAGLEHALDAVNLEKTRCIIITGAGKKAFAAGADIGSMQNFTQEEGKAFSQYGSHVFRKIETFPIPVIAAVNGYALGGGCELAMACDIRIASENAVLGNRSHSGIRRNTASVQAHSHRKSKGTALYMLEDRSQGSAGGGACKCSVSQRESFRAGYEAGTPYWAECPDCSQSGKKSSQ